MVQKWGGIGRISWWNYLKNGQLLQAMATHTRIVRTIQKKDCLNPLDSHFLLFWFLLRCDAVDVAGEHRALLDIVNA